MPCFTTSRRWPALLASVLVLACGDEDLGPRVPAGIVITPAEPRIVSRLRAQLTARVVDANAKELDGVAVSFASADAGIVTVDATGLLTSIGPRGTSVITATAGDLTARVEAEVVLPASSVVTNFVALSLEPGELAGVSAFVTDGRGDSIPDAAVLFQSSDPAVVAIDATGLVTGGSEGQATITASSGTLHTDIPVTVAQVVGGVAMTPESVVLSSGGSQQLSATLIDRSGGDPVPGGSFGWSSSDESVVTVSQTGMVRSVGPEGSAIITATSGGFSHELGVFVGTPPAGELLASVPVEWAWGVTLTPSGRFLVAAKNGHLLGGTLPDLSFTTNLQLPGLAYGAAVNQAETRAYIAGTADPSFHRGVGVLDLATSTVTDVFPVSGVEALAVALSTDESRLMVGTAFGLEVIDIAARRSVLGLAIGTVTQIIRHPTLPLLYASNGKVVELDGTTGAIRRTFTGTSGALEGIAVSPDGTHLYAGALFENAIEVWNLNTGARERTITVTGANGLAFSPDGRFLYAATRGALLILEPTSGALVRKVTFDGELRRIAVAPDGTAIATDFTLDPGDFVYFIR